MIGLKGAPHGLHSDSLGWMKISTFERGDRPLPEHRGARGVARCWALLAWRVGCEDVRACNAPVASNQFW